MFYDARTIQAERAAALSSFEHGHGMVVVNNKSMRKQCENNSSLALIIGGDLIPTSLQVFVNLRVLFLLP